MRRGRCADRPGAALTAVAERIFSAVSTDGVRIGARSGSAGWGLEGLGPPCAQPDVAAKLDERGVAIEPGPVDCLVGEGTSLSAIRLRNGVEQPIDALFVGPRSHFNSDIAERLGCAVEDGPLGSVVTVDEMKATNVAGVYVAGDITRSLRQPPAQMSRAWRPHPSAHAASMARSRSIQSALSNPSRPSSTRSSRSSSAPQEQR